MYQASQYVREDRTCLIVTSACGKTVGTIKCVGKYTTLILSGKSSLLNSCATVMLLKKLVCCYI